MKYYITKADEMVGPLEMEKPEFNYEFGPDGPSEAQLEEAEQDFDCACGFWQQHLASLPRVKHRLPNKVGDIVEEGKDFEWRHFCEACTSLGGGIRHCAHPEECGQVIRAAFPKEEKPVEESFTKEDMIGFAEWLAGNDYRMSRKEKGVWYCHTGHSVTTSGLLTKYLTNKSRNNEL